MFKRFGFALERIDQLLKMFHKFKVSIIHSYMYGSRISVIGGLWTIDMIVRWAVLVFAAFIKDSIRLLPGKQTKFGIGNGCSHFGNGKSVDKQRIFVQMKFTDTEILDTSESLYSIHGAFRYFTAAD